MDEMNPAFENFLNNMSRLGGTPRETTRRVSASSFLGKDIDIERRVNNNSKKISIIARILKSRRANTAGIEKSILDIKNTMSSIVQTLEAQEKFEYEKFLETQRQLENQKRRGRETSTEKDKPIKDFFSKQVEKVVAPVRNGFLRFIMFFINLIAGKFIIGILKFLSNPRNIGIVNFISGFIEKFFPLILGGIAAATVGIVFLLGKMVGLTGMLNIAAAVLGGVIPGGAFLKNLKNIGPGIKSIGNTVPNMISKFIMPKIIRMYDEGGSIVGKKHSEGGEIIEAEDGEFVVNAKAMKQPGAAEAVEMINAGKFSELGKLMSGMSGDDKLNLHRSIEAFFNNPVNQIYTQTITDKEGKTTYKADMSGFERYKNFMTESYGGMSGYMPDVGKFAESTISGSDAKLAKQFFTNRGTTMGAEINKVIPGTDEFFLNAVSQSINESADARRIKGTNNIPTITPPIEDLNDGGSMLDFSSLPSSSANDKSTTLRNELPSCSLNSSDSNKCDTLGMLMT